MVQTGTLKNAPAIYIVGCTASGKSRLAVEVAKRLGTDVISCDSMQVYKGMNIGTAKPSLEEREMVRHHMIDVVSPDESFTVSNYASMVADILEDYSSVPLYAGGTGLYVDSLLYGYNFADTCASPEVRKKLNELLTEKGRGYLYDLLKRVDPISAAETHENNVVRVMRALEIYMVSGKPKSQLRTENRSAQNYLAFDIQMDRQQLYDRIDKRVDDMFGRGVIEEVRGLLNCGYDRNLTSLAAIGYKEVISYLHNEITLDQAHCLVKQNTRNYAKRQITWFKRMPGIIHLQEGDAMWETVIRCFDEKIKNSV